MRRLELVEYRLQRAVALSPDECDMLRRLYPQIQIAPAIGAAGRYDVTPVERIGVVCLPDLVIEIRPKIPMSSVAFLISYACDAARWLEPNANFAAASDLAELLSMMLARLVQHSTRRGLLNGYQPEDDALRAPRGRIRFDEQIRRRAGLFPPVEISHDVFTSDVIENRLLLAALATMQRLPYRSDMTARELARARQLFGGVRSLHFAPSAVPEVLFTRLNRHYEPAVTLARMLLRSASLDLGHGFNGGSAFLIDMNVVFERFVRSALREALGTTVAEFPDRFPGFFLDQNESVPIKPDLAWVRGRNVNWVGDVKYKHLTGSPQNADLYQLLAYAMTLGLPGGTLIYAAERGIRAAEYVVKNALKCLRVVAIDLSAPPVQILSQVATLAERIRTETRN
jgi:5-methylcytosine-specific restriction enzyme subunit McrC